MTDAARLKEYIKNLPEDQPFPSNSLRGLTNTANLRQVLNRLVKAGELKRVVPGVFIKPKYMDKIGEVPPSVVKVIEAVTNSCYAAC